MALEVIHDVPVEDHFTPLSVHESQTPDSFFSGKPVLYVHSRSCQVSLPAAHAALLEGDAKSGGFTNGSVNGHGDVTPDAFPLISEIDVWVSSQRLILFNTPRSHGVSIPYPSITLHAIKDRALENASGKGLYMQISTTAPEDAAADDEDGVDDDIMELTIIPTPESNGLTDDVVQELYETVTRCSNLHPDVLSPSSDPDEPPPILFEGSVGYESGILLPDGMSGASNASSLPPPVPGSGGWITAENVGEFFDEDGNWKGRGGDVEGDAALGPGAGTVRERDSAEMDEAGAEEEGTKWQKTE